MLGVTEILLIIVAFLLVLSVLAFLFVRNKKAKKNLTPQKEAFVSETVGEPTITAAEDAENAENDELVAAFLALHLYTSEEIHDEESNVLTIDRIQRRYSPWSSKIYSMNNFQR